MYLKKDKGKSKPIAINKETQRSITSFKNRLKEMLDNREVSEQHQKLILYLLNDLEDYDLNILIAFYDQANCSPSKLSKLLGLDPSNITSKINKIISQCKRSISY